MDDTHTNDSEHNESEVNRLLTQNEAEELGRLLDKLTHEMTEQLHRQGMSSDPVSYKTLARVNFWRYLNEVYGIDRVQYNIDAECTGDVCDEPSTVGSERPYYEDYNAVVDADSVVGQLSELKENGCSRFENLVIDDNGKTVKLAGMFYIPYDGVERSKESDSKQGGDVGE